jgi:endonuclease G
MFRAQIKDYKNSGFDRGHLAAAADFKDKISYKESFLLTNVSPQVGKGFNRDYWRYCLYLFNGLVSLKSLSDL